MLFTKKYYNLAPLLVMVMERLYSNPYVRTVLENKCNLASSHRGDDPTPTLTVDGIRTRNIMGEFDLIKEELLGVR